MASLRISEIFLSLQGESRTVGLPTVFVRLTGCPLRCVWCDTSHAFTGGVRQNLDEILQSIASYGIPRVCVTGGEPLAQPDVLKLLDRLLATHYEVSLETSGSMSIADVNPKVSRVLDLKPPGSGEEKANRYDNIALLTAHDQVKFVIQDEADYRWAIAKMAEYQLTDRCEVLFSPVAGERSPVWLAEKIVADRLNVRFQLQLHKILWGDKPGV